MNKVFIPQVPSKYNSDARIWLPIVNIKPAEKYGEIVIMLPPEAKNLATAPMIDVIRERLAMSTADDYLVAAGDPSMIAAAAAIMSRRAGGILRLLKWDRDVRDYIVAEIRT